MTNQDVTRITTITARDTRPEIKIEALLDDGGQTKAMRNTLRGIIGFTAIFILWSIFAQVEELSKAHGEVQPIEQVQALQTEEGGSLSRVLVREGDLVKKGQVIAEFSATNMLKDKAQAETKLHAVAITREQIQAVLENREPVFDEFEEAYPKLVEEAKANYISAVNSRHGLAVAKTSEKASLQSQLKAERTTLKLIEQEIGEARQRLASLEEGVKKGVVTRLSLSEAKQQSTVLQERRNESQSKIASLTRSIEQVDAEIERMLSDSNSQLGEELSRLTEQYRELESEHTALSERHARAVVTSPFDGVVMNLPHNREGAVIPAGGTVAEVVPAGENVVMEVMVTPRDIGFVKQGQRAYVKIDSYDPARFGTVEGTVSRIAPTSTRMKETGAPFYKVEISLATPFVKNRDHLLVPGMTGEADIATGKKSVIQYLLKPVFLTSDTAFHER